MKLIYIGNGFIPGIPARNLTKEEVKKYGEKFLLETGLYKKPETKKVTKEVTQEGEKWQDQEHYESYS